MKDNQEVEKQIKVKLSGQNKRSYLDIACKQPSSTLIIDQDDPINKMNQTKNYALPTFQGQFENDASSKISSSHQIGDSNIYQLSSRIEQNESEQINANYKYEVHQSDSSQISQRKSTQYKQFYQNQTKAKKSVYYDKQKKLSVFTQKQENKNKVNHQNKQQKTKFQIKLHLSNFINKYTSFGRLKQLKEQSRVLLNDLSDKQTYMPHHYKYSALSHIIQIFLLFLKNFEKLAILIFQKFPLFNPENKFRILINSLIACYNCFYLFTISLTLFFQAQFGNYGHLFHNVAIAAWIFEMILQMNTATYHDGDFITDRKAIFRIYVKEYFFFEVLPLIFEGKTSSNAAVNILLHLPLLLKLKGMSIILSKLEFLILQHLRKPHILQICKQMLSILLLVHIMACSYSTLAHFEKSVLLIQENWIEILHQYVILPLDKIQKIETSWWHNYIEAQLWAFYTLSSSYSSSVTSQYEQVFTSIWMLISYVIFAYNLMALKTILQDMNSSKENYKKELNLLNRYMKRKRIDLELQRAINSHVVKHYEQEESAQLEAEKEALNKLSPHIRNKLIMESNKHIINQFSFINNLSQQTIIDLYQIIEEECFVEGQNVEIFDRNTNDFFIYFIISGKIEILQSMDEVHQNLSSQNYDKHLEDKHKNSSKAQPLYKQICVLKDGQAFGELEFISNQCYPYVVKCLQKTVLIKISSQKFYEIIRKNKNDLQKISELKQRVLLDKQIELLKLQCLTCKEKDHYFTSCYQTHFNKSSYFLAAKNNFSKKQERSNFNRGIKKNQMFILELKTTQIFSNNDQSDQVVNFSQQQIYPQMEDETSIFNQQNSSQIQNKFKKEETKSEQSDSSEQENNAIKEKINEEVINQFKNVLSNIGNKRSSVRSNLSSKKQQGKNIDRQDSFQFQDKIDLMKKLSANYDEKISSQNTDDKNVNNYLNNSQNNLSEQIPSQTILYPIPLAPSQFNKSSNQLPSLQIIKKQTQFQHQIYLESIPELDKFHHNLSDQFNKHSEQTQNSFFRGNSLVPLSTAHGKRFSVRNRNSLNLQSPLKIENEIFQQFWNRSSLYWAFDKLANFVYFFPQFNCKNILRNTKYFKEKRNTIRQAKKSIN